MTRAKLYDIEGNERGDLLGWTDLGPAGGFLRNEANAAVLFSKIDFENAYLPGIPANAAKRRSMSVPLSGTHNYVLPGEAIPVLTHMGWSMPDQGTRGLIRQLLGKRLRLDLLDEHPRLKNLLGLYHEAHPQGFYWLQEPTNWRARFGEVRPGGWYDFYCARGTDGYSNWHYHQLLWLLLAYLDNPTDMGYLRGMTQAVAQAAFGLDWRNGMFRNEKGGAALTSGYPGHIGEGGAPSPAKQFFAGLVGWAMISQHPFLWAAVERHLSWLRILNSTWYDGSWGIRRCTHWLWSLLTAYDITRDDVFRRKAHEGILNARNLCDRDDTASWIQRQGVTSPWMQAKHAACVNAWHRFHGVGSLVKPFSHESAVVDLDARKIAYRSHNTGALAVDWNGSSYVHTALYAGYMYSRSLSEAGSAWLSAALDQMEANGPVNSWCPPHLGPGAMKGIPMVLMGALM